MESRLKTLDLFKMFVRCFFIQGSWNFKSLIGLGFCYCVIPIAKRFYKSESDQQEFLKRHLMFFNAHPYYANFCLGAVAKLEEEAYNKEWQSVEPITIFKERLAGPLGSIGDQFFWNGIKPLAAGISMCLALYIQPGYKWIAVPAFIILYNVPHMIIRARGIILGYKKGFDIIPHLSVKRYETRFKIIKIIGSMVAGLCVIASLKYASVEGTIFTRTVLASTVITFFMLRNKQPIKLILVIVALVSLLLAYFN